MLIWCFSFRIFFHKNSHWSILFFNKHLLSSILTILSDSLCTIAFQLLVYQKEFDTKFSKKLHDTLSLIKSTTFRSTTIKSKERQIKFNSVDTHNFFFSSDWVVDKIKIRAVIKQFFKNIVDYRLVLSKETEISALSISAFTENKFLTSQLTHIKRDSSVSDDIFIIWSNIDDICSQNSNTMSDQSESSKNIFFNFEIISEQMQALFDTLTAAMNTKINRLNNELRQLLQFISQQSSQSQIFKNEIMRDRSSKDLISKKVGFFDSTVDEQRSVVNLKKHVFYRDIFAFVNRLKNVSSVREKNKLRLIISQCLRDIVLIWHSTELFDVEKEIYRNMSLQNWCNVLIKRFKERTSAALNFIQSTKYTLQDARMQKNFRVFAQNLFRHVKAASLISIYNQLILTWNNLDWQFKQHISQFAKNITVQVFLKQLDNNCDIWFELANSNQNFKRFSISKPFYQDAAKRNTNRYFSQSNRSLSKQDFTYQNQNRKKSSNVEITVKMKSTKESNDREFERDSRNRIYDRKKRDRIRMTFRDKNTKDFKTKDKDKTKAYIAHEENDNASASEFNDSMNSDLQYFDFDYDEFYDSEKIIEANHVIALNVFCRRCTISFSSNNMLHKHIRSNSCSKISKSSVYVSDNNDFNTKFKIRIIRFEIDSNKNIETEYDFRSWHYATIMISLHENEKPDFECLNIEADVTFADIKYFQKKFKDIFIRTMIALITVRDLETNKHSIDKYAICSMYFADIDSDENAILTEIIRKIHLVNNLKTNLLIENDILDSELIDIFTFTNSAFIESCKIKISITIRARSVLQIRFIHALEINISTRSKIVISIHKITVSERDYMFESKEVTNLSVYAHIIDDNIISVLIRNENDTTIHISRNFRLKNLIELDYSNVLQMSAEHSNLALRISRSMHKQCWFNKIINAYISAISTDISMNTDSTIIKNCTHSLEIIIHNSSSQAIKAFTDVVNKYAELWTNKEFVELSQKNWMRISFKTDWESKIKEKIKMYSFEVKDKLIVDETFDRLHEQDRFFWTFESIFFNFSCFVVWRESFDKKKNRVVIDIRTLNAIFLSDVYLLFLQNEIIQTVHDCTFISIMNCISFFYQWRVHSDDRHRLIVITHREQKTFNVVVMNYRNSLVYVQRQIDRILRFCRHFARAYIDDIVIFFKFLKKHISHLKCIFKFMTRNNISVNFRKTFLKFSFVTLLKQHVNFLSLSTNKKKIKAVTTLTFSKTLSDFETYLDLIDWFRNYIESYVKKSESFQNRKIRLLKESSKSNNARKAYVCKTKFVKSITKKIHAFQEIQKHFVKAEFLIHFETDFEATSHHKYLTIW